MPCVEGKKEKELKKNLKIELLQMESEKMVGGIWESWDRKDPKKN